MTKKTAHPVWDLSNSDEGPVIVRKVPEEAERAKGSDLGWLNKNVATYIGGQPVVAKVAKIHDDGTYDLVTKAGEHIDGVAEEFIHFLGNRDGAEGNAPSRRSAQWYKNLLKGKDKPQSATPAQDTPKGKFTKKQPPSDPTSPEGQRYYQNKLPTEQDLEPRPKGQTPASAEFGSEYELIGETIRPMLHSITKSLDTHRKKYLNHLLKKIDKAWGKNNKEIATDRMLRWLRTQQVDQRALGNIHRMLTNTTPKNEGKYDIGMEEGLYPQHDISQSILKSKGKQNPVAIAAQDYITRAGGDYDAARSAVQDAIDRLGDEGPEVKRLYEIQEAISEIEVEYLNDEPEEGESVKAPS